MHDYNPAAAEGAIRRTAEVIARRDVNAVEKALQKLREDADGGQNTMPAMMEAVRAYATIGEITAALKEVFGEFSEPVNI